MDAAVCGHGRGPGRVREPGARAPAATEGSLPSAPLPSRCSPPTAAPLPLLGHRGNVRRPAFPAHEPKAQSYRHLGTKLQSEGLSLQGLSPCRQLFTTLSHLFTKPAA